MGYPMITERKAKKLSTTAIVYIILRVLVIGILIHGIVIARWDQVFYCAIALVEFMIPSFVEKKLKIELPSGLEIVVLLFIFAGEILGEIGEFYNRIHFWDLILHTINGFLMAAIGVALIDVLNKHPKINLSLSPFFVAFVAFCFSMTIGVLWEFTEYSSDKLFGSDMQKDSIVQTVKSEELDPNRETPLVIGNITQTTIEGTVKGSPAEVTVDGYLDIGLNDTMGDLFVNFLGAIVFSFIAALYIKDPKEGGGQVAEAFIPHMLTEEELSELESKK